MVLPEASHPGKYAGTELLQDSQSLLEASALTCANRCQHHFQMSAVGEGVLAVEDHLAPGAIERHFDLIQHIPT